MGIHEMGGRVMLDADHYPDQYSEYLTFRSFLTGFPVVETNEAVVASHAELIDVIKSGVGRANVPALLLSGGMDSAVLAPFMPTGSAAYTIYHGRIKKNEVNMAGTYAAKFGLRHVVLEVDPDEYIGVIDELMIAKGMPLSPAEPVLYLAARRAKNDGGTHVLSGGGADGRWGGFRSLRKNLPLGEYVDLLGRTYLDPTKILVRGRKVDRAVSSFLYKNKKGELVVNSRDFFNKVGVERFAFNNAMTQAGVSHVAPFVESVFRFDNKINKQRPKYFIEDMYDSIYGHAPPKKFGLQKPVYLLSKYRPQRPEFRQDFDYESLDYNRRFLVYSLERFMALRESGKV